MITAQPQSPAQTTFQAPPAAATGVPNQMPDPSQMQLPPQTPIPPSPPSSFGGKKKFLFIGIGLVVLIIIIAVIIGLVSANSKTPSEEEGNAELTYWAVYEDPKVMQVLIDEFQRENPNIKVSFEQRDPSNYRDQLMTRIRNGNGPDIFRYHNSWIPTMMGVLLPLSQDAIAPDDYEKAYYPVIVTDLVQNGAILGVPLGIDTLAMYTNNELLGTQSIQAPTDWVTFTKDAGILTTKVPTGETKGQITTAGTALGTYANITHAPDIISLMLVQAGVDLYDITKAQAEEERDGCQLKACQALLFYTAFAKGSTDVTKVWDGSLDRSVVAFANGKVALYFGYSWDMSTIKNINPNLDYSVYAVPNLSQVNKKTIASYWVEGVSSKTLYPIASMKFMKFLHEKETQQKYFAERIKLQQLGKPYARVDLAESLKSDPKLYPFVEQASYAVSTPFSSDTHDNGLTTALNKNLEEAILDLSTNASAKSAVETLADLEKQTFTNYVRK